MGRLLLFSILLLIPTPAHAGPGVGSLSGRIGALYQQYQGPELKRSLWVEDLKTGEVLFQSQSQQSLIPASNLKLLTLLTALKELGPHYRFKTQLWGKGLNASGHLEELTLKGFGDPSLTSEDLWKLAGTLRAQGIRSVGKLTLDDLFFDERSFPGRLKNTQIDAAFNAPVSALSVDQNLLTLVVQPGPKAGAPATISLDPPLPDFPLENQVLTQGGKARILVRNLRKHPLDETLLIKGQIPLRGEPQIYTLAQSQPTAMTGRRLLKALKSHGIQTPTHWQEAPVPPGAKLLYEALSPPLAQILGEVGKNSNNFSAEQIVKTLGALKVGEPGTTPKGVQVLMKTLRTLPLSLEGVQIENGSGLSRNNFLTVQVLVQILKAAYGDPFLRQDFLSSLSVLGVDGTLKNRYYDKGLEWHFRGKTGTLSGVTSLSGLVVPKNKQQGPYLLAFMANGRGASFWKQRQFEQKLLELLIQP